MGGHYKQRLENMILAELTSLVSREVRDPRLEDLVFTAASLNADFSVARISFMADEDAEEEVAEGLASASGFLRGEVGRALKLREAPELRFSPDDSLDRYNRIESVLSEETDETVLDESDKAEN